MAVRELGMVYASQMANEGIDYLVDAVPTEIAGVKAVDLVAGAAGALTAMNKLPIRGDMATVVEIAGLGRLAKATMKLVSGMMPTPTAGMRIRPLSVGNQSSIRITGTSTPAPSGNGALAPAGY